MSEELSVNRTGAMADLKGNGLRQPPVFLPLLPCPSCLFLHGVVPRASSSLYAAASMVFLFL